MKKVKIKFKDRVTKNQLYSAIGLFLILFSVIGMVNYTPVAQFFTYCIAFLFGTIGAYFVYCLIFLYGLSLAISKKTRIKMSFVIGGLFLILLGILIIFANSTYSNETGYLTFNGTLINGNAGPYNFKDAFKESFAKFPSIDYTKNVGCIGLLLVCIINSTMSNIGSFCFGGVFISLGTVFILLKYVVKFSRYLKHYIKVLKEKEKMQIYKDAKDVEVDDKAQKEIVENKKDINETILINEIKVEEIKEDKIEEKKNDEPLQDGPISNHFNETFSEVSNTNGLKKATFDFENNNNLFVNQTNDNLVKEETFANPFINNEVKNEPINKNEEIYNKPIINEPINNNYVASEPVLNEQVINELTLENKEEVNEEVNVEPIEEIKEEVIKHSDYDNTIKDIFKEESLITEEEKEIFNKQPIEEIKEEKEYNEIKFEEQKNPVEKAKSTVERISDNIYAPRVTNTDKRRQKPYDYPSLSLLPNPDLNINNTGNVIVNDQRVVRINKFFEDFNLGAKINNYDIGPAITRFDVVMNSGVSSKCLENKMDDLSRELEGVSCRFVPIIKGKNACGIEVPNVKINSVYLKEVLQGLPPINQGKYTGLWMGLGKDISGKIIACDIGKLTHILVTGTSGSGKSVFIQSFLLTLLMRNNPDELRLIIVDPKQVEFARYHDLPHLLCPILTDADQAYQILLKLQEEMEYRYSIMKEGDYTDIKDYNSEYCKPNNLPTIPNIICILDEYNDLIDSCSQISKVVQILSAKARAAGIHLVIATQTPRASIMSGPIKNNFSTRIALLCSSSSDSVNVIGEGGAEKLAGNGDMLVRCPLFANDGLIRVQGAFIDTKDCKTVIESIRNRYPNEYYDKFMDCLIEKDNNVSSEDQMERVEKANDALYEEVKKACLEEEYYSISKITRTFGLGFGRAGKIFDALVAEGIIERPNSSSNKGSKVIGYKGPSN